MLIKQKVSISLFLLFTFGCNNNESNFNIDQQVNTSNSNSDFLVLNRTLTENLQASNKKGKEFFVQPNSNDFNNIPQDPKNKITKAKVDLGQMLFHDPSTGLGNIKERGAKTYSCSSCHHAKAGFQSGIRQGLGEGGFGFGRKGEGRSKDPNYKVSEVDFQPIRTPAALNTAWQKNMLWNGQLGARGSNVGTESLWIPTRSASFIGQELNKLGFDGVETQAIAGQDAHRLNLSKFISKSAQYQLLFAKAYPNIKTSERITKINAAKAIAAFERTVISNQSPFQRWLKGDTKALSRRELIGGSLFFGKASCVSCHTGPALNKMEFHALGFNDMVGNNVLGSDPSSSAHKGRGGFTGKFSDMYKFKVPQLYNLSDVRSLGHGGSFRSIRSIVEYLNKGVSQNKNVPKNQLSNRFKPLNLTKQEINDLTLFLEKSLKDPNLERYQPKKVPSGDCFPNNDDKSKKDLGCV